MQHSSRFPASSSNYRGTLGPSLCRLWAETTEMSKTKGMVMSYAAAFSSSLCDWCVKQMAATNYVYGNSAKLLHHQTVSMKNPRFLGSWCNILALTLPGWFSFCPEQNLVLKWIKRLVTTSRSCQLEVSAVLMRPVSTAENDDDNASSSLSIIIIAIVFHIGALTFRFINGYYRRLLLEPVAGGLPFATRPRRQPLQLTPRSK